MLTLQIVRDIVRQYLDHPRHHNAGQERLLFVLLNWFIYAVQIWERGKFTDAILAEMDKTDNPETLERLRAILMETQSREYIVQGSEEASP